MSISNRAELCEGSSVNAFPHSAIRVINNPVAADVRRVRKAAVNTPALQTLRAVQQRSAIAKRLECACLQHRFSNPPSYVGGYSQRERVAHKLRRWLPALLAGSLLFPAVAEETNNLPSTNSIPAAVESAPQANGESAFRIITERNIFNANRSGGQVRLASRRPSRIEYFTLVGTMAYEKGTFAFFEGSSSEFTKVMKADGVIAGHKVMDIHANSVKIEADGKQIELPVGSQMRREDEGAWQVAEARSSGLSVASSSNGESSSRNSRSDRGSDASNRSRRESDSSRNRGENSASGSRSSTNTSSSGADQAEALKRLMERREKESQ